MDDTQNFAHGELVAWVDASNRLRYGIVARIEDEDQTDRVVLLNHDGTYQAAPTRDRVAHLKETPS